MNTSNFKEVFESPKVKTFTAQVAALKLEVVLLRALNAALVSIPEEFGTLQYEENRLILNAREQITRMEMVAAALKANDRDGFDEAIKKLEAQAAF